MLDSRMFDMIEHDANKAQYISGGLWNGESPFNYVDRPYMTRKSQKPTVLTVIRYIIITKLY